MECGAKVSIYLSTYLFNMSVGELTNLCKCHRPYNTFSECTEEFADCLLIPWPNPVVEQTFVEIHTKYFQDCTVEELRDPPPSVLFALVMTPICLIPAMVFLVVLKTKNGDGRSWHVAIIAIHYSLITHTHTHIQTLSVLAHNLCLNAHVIHSVCISDLSDDRLTTWTSYSFNVIVNTFRLFAHFIQIVL